MLDKTMDENLSEKMGLEPITANDGAIVPEVVTPKPEDPMEKLLKKEEGDLPHDYNTVRKAQLNMIETGQEAIQQLALVAAESDQPRAYEVLGTMMKMLSEVTKDLMDNHHRVRKMVAETNGPTTTHVHQTTNSLFVGTTSELQNLLRPDRAPSKAFIDVDVEDNLPSNPNGAMEPEKVEIKKRAT